MKTRSEELRLTRADVPALTITTDPGHSVKVSGHSRPDWLLRLCATARGHTDTEALEWLDQLRMTRRGSAISLIGSSLGSAASDNRPRGQLIVEAPDDAWLMIHAPYSYVVVHDMSGRLHVAAPHARAKILDATGETHATAGSIDFRSVGGGATLTADEINLELPAHRFDGTLIATARRAVKVAVSAGFVTPIQAVVPRVKDFVCRAEFASRVRHEKKGAMHYFTFGGEAGQTDRPPIHLQSEQATVVIDCR